MAVHRRQGALAWYRFTQQRLAKTDFKIDISYLFTDDVPGGALSYSDIPAELQQHVAPPEEATA